MPKKSYLEPWPRRSWTPVVSSRFSTDWVVEDDWGPEGFMDFTLEELSLERIWKKRKWNFQSLQSSNRLDSKLSRDDFLQNPKFNKMKWGMINEIKNCLYMQTNSIWLMIMYHFIDIVHFITSFWKSWYIKVKLHKGHKSWRQF